MKNIEFEHFIKTQTLKSNPDDKQTFKQFTTPNNFLRTMPQTSPNKMMTLS